MANEKEQLSELKRIRDLSAKMTVGEMVKEMMTVSQYYHLGRFYDQLNDIAEDYGRVKYFMRQGTTDEMRSTLYKAYKARLCFTLEQMIHGAGFDVVPSLMNARKTGGEVAVWDIEKNLTERSQNVVIAQLEGDEAVSRAYMQLYDHRNKVFNRIFILGPLTKDDADVLCSLLVSKSLEAADKKLIVSALMLALQRSFDSQKFQVLLKALAEEDDDDVAQRLLVAVALTLPAETEIINDQLLKTLFQSTIIARGYLRTLCNLQLQMLYSVTAADDRKKMENEIMPTILDEVKRQKLMDPDASSLDDILHPNKEEAAMEALEGKLDKMREMQQSGSDMLFGGFSSMKRYGFFYTLTNWFIPYSCNHPEVARLTTEPALQQLFTSLSNASQLCDSDKYSMAFGLNHVFGSLPEALKKMLQSGEAKIGVLDEELNNDVDYRRRMYLQDLYRFYNLYSSKQDFSNPFLDVKRWCFITHPFIFDILGESNFLVSFAHKLIQKNRIADAERVLLADKTHAGSLDHLVLQGTCHARCHRYSEAVSCYQQALFLDNENIKLQHRLASVAIEARKWNVAVQTYRDIIDSNPEDSKAQLGLSEALLHQQKTSEASNHLLPFDFIDNPTNRMSSLIGWYYLLDEKPQQALNSYKRIAVDDLKSVDLLRLVFVHLCLKDYATAAATLALVLKAKEGSVTIADELSGGIDYLALAKITRQEWDILLDIANEE